MNWDDSGTITSIVAVSGTVLVGFSTWLYRMIRLTKDDGKADNLYTRQERTIEDLNVANKDLQNRISVLQTKISDLEKTIAFSGAEVMIAKNAKEHAESQRDHFEKQVNGIKSKLDDIDRINGNLSAQIVGLETENALLRDSIAKYKEDLDKSNNIINELRKTIVELEREIEADSEAYDRLANSINVLNDNLVKKAGDNHEALKLEPIPTKQPKQTYICVPPAPYNWNE
jgi:chromosome segregation ATPase